MNLQELIKILLNELWKWETMGPDLKTALPMIGENWQLVTDELVEFE